VGANRSCELHGSLRDAPSHGFNGAAFLKILTRALQACRRAFFGH